jgi:hypothetical protein
MNLKEQQKDDDSQKFAKFLHGNLIRKNVYKSPTLTCTTIPSLEYLLLDFIYTIVLHQILSNTKEKINNFCKYQ